MIESNGALSSAAEWLLELWIEKFTGVFESMAEQRPSTTWQSGGDQSWGEGALVLEQRFIGTAEPMLWVGFADSLDQEIGRRVLKAAGLENSEAEENRATCLEIAEQTMAGFVRVLAQRMSREIERAPVETCTTFPDGPAPLRVSISVGGEQLPPLFLALSPVLVSWSEAKSEESEVPLAVTKPEEVIDEVPPASKTFDLLLDVALPVSVSFGKAELPIKDVLKLTTGSIVELNRSVSEPVDIIVNGCTIARGQVVVVEGNYGVRINNIVSRKERLHTSSSALAR